MLRRKSVAAFAAVTLALAIPVATAGPASAETRPAPTLAAAGLAPGSLPCVLTMGVSRIAGFTGYSSFGSFLSDSYVRSGCAG